MRTLSQHRTSTALLTTFAIATALLLTGLAAAQAEPLRVGVILSQSGAARATGEAQVAALAAERSGTIEVLLRDDRSDPREAERQASELLAAGVEALVCCTTDPASARVAELAQREGVLLLAPSTVPPPTQAPYAFGLAPSDATDLRSVVAYAFARRELGVGLMTLDNAFGEAAATRLAAELQVAGMALVADERYRPDATVLTPEALWVATRQPGAVVVWGLRADTTVAVEALRRRGYVGTIYARGKLLRGGAGLDPAVFAAVRFPVAPLAVADALPADHPSAAAAARLRGLLAGVYGYRDPPAAAAFVADALTLLQEAQEQAALYGVPRDDARAYRQALRDAAVALGPLAGAGGRYDLVEGTSDAAQPGGSVMAEFGPRGLTPVR